MGYHSEVAIRCQDKAFEMFKEAWSKFKFIPDKIYHHKDDHLIYWDYVKWYEDYPDVSAIENIMSELNKLSNDEAIEKKMGYRFMRLGEDDTDIETKDNTYDIGLWMIRKIDLSDFESK